MKRILFRLFMGAVFVLLFGFALKNTDNVAVRYFLGFEWEAPLALVLLVFFGLGVAGGLATSAAMMARQRREILDLKRQLRSVARTPAVPIAATAESL